MKGKGGKSGKGSPENKTCKSKNMTGAARVGDCRGHPCSTVPAAPRAVPVVTTGVCVPLPPTHTHPTASPTAGPPHGAGPAPAGLVAMSGSGLGQQSRSCSQAQVTLYPRNDAAWWRLCGTSWAAPPGLYPTAKSSPMSTARLHSCWDTLCPQAGHCSHAPGALYFAFPPALEKRRSTWHFPGAGDREQILLGASSQK